MFPQQVGEISFQGMNFHSGRFLVFLNVLSDILTSITMKIVLKNSVIVKVNEDYSLRVRDKKNLTNLMKNFSF